MTTATQVDWDKERVRATKKTPCPICGKKDYCTFFPRLGKADCMRVESPKPAKNGGFWHDLPGSGATVLRVRSYLGVAPEPEIDADALWRRWASETSPGKIKELAQKLGVKEMALASLGCVWIAEKGAWGFPMRDAMGEIVGIKLRTPSGDRFCIQGSHSGLFLADVDVKNEAMICEGESDTAAALSMKLYAIGRPSCIGLEQLVNDTIKRLRIRRVILIADNDDPGIRGAEKLQSGLKVPSVCVIPPLKDIRESYRAGWTVQDLQNLIKERVWKVPR